MVEEMKFEESLLTGYLVKNLEPLTEADPLILSKYVVALLKKDKPLKELQKLCTDNLVEFLGNGAKSFTAELFQALEDGSFVKVDRTLDAVQGSEPSLTEGIHHLKNSSAKKEDLSTSSEHSSDPEDKEVSDDDDDRNHKHRRREARQSSFENDSQEQFIRRPSRKRNKPYVNGQNFLDNDTQTSDNQKEYNPTSERSIFSKFDKHRSDLTPLLRPPVDLCQRTRFGQPLRNDPGVRFDLSTSVGRPSLGRGRGRSTIPWSQHDSRFNHDTFDFASQMASQGPAHPGLFVGTGLPSTVGSQSSSWGGFGFIPGMTNRIMDPLNPLGLPGALRPTINPSLSLNMPRQRCRDFEERGFCLRGDMCPMEHGLNRIVVEDVQSLSQFNLPVSIPSSHGLGIQVGSGSLPPIPPPSGQLANNNIAGRSSKTGVADEESKQSDVAVSSRGGDADVYDPDQPLWNNDPPDTSATLLRLPTPNPDEEPSWDGDSSAHQSFRSDGLESELPSRRITGNIGSQNRNSSVWGRVGSRNKLDPGNRVRQRNVAGDIRNDIKEDHEKVINSSQGKGAASVEIGSIAMPVQPFPRPHTDAGHKSGRVFPKALRTLYVYGVPQKSNRKEALISHFQKFGAIVDIYIPLNSEKAFVQFSKREEAEAALKSPDAVMGNRFIKLSWANRDRIPDDGQSTGQSKSVQSPSVMITSVPSQQAAVNEGKEPVRISTQTTISTTSDSPTPAAGLVKSQTVNALKAALPMQKKLENLELLEELRRKQESLAKKRDDFKRQLDKFEKQAISSKKVDAASDKAVKRRKVDSSNEAEKATITMSSDLSTLETHQVADKTLEKRNSDEVLTLNSSKVNSTILQQSSKTLNQTSPVPASLPSRFKLDNRSTSFRILPPLPADLANVSVLKDHFSRYGVVLSVILEEPEIHTENEDLKQSENCSACVTFSTRHSAERAYQNGKLWEGHSLQFKWLTVPLHSNSDCGVREPSSVLSPKVLQALNPSNPAVPRSSSSSADKSTVSLISEVVAVGNIDHNQDNESKNCASFSLPTFLVENTRSSPTMSSNEKRSSE